MKKACIVGYGAIGPVHAAALEACKTALLTAVCEIDPARAALCGQKYPVKIYTDFEKMLEDDSIDVVHICTPHYLHAQMAKESLLAGKDVVLEKPVAMNEGELSSLLSVKTEKQVCVMLQNRTNRCLVKLKEIIDQDTSLGKMKGICAFLTWERTREYYEADAWRGKWQTEGGGLLINQAIHTLDILDWLGGGISSVRASISTKKLSETIEVEDTADALFEMKNGCRGVFYGTNCYSGSAPMRVEVAFEKVTFRYADGRLYKITDDQVEILEDDNRSYVGKSYWGSGHFRVISRFYGEEEGPVTTLEDAVHVMKVLYAMYTSDRSGGMEILCP